MVAVRGGDRRGRRYCDVRSPNVVLANIDHSSDGRLGLQMVLASGAIVPLSGMRAERMSGFAGGSLAHVVMCVAVAMGAGMRVMSVGSRIVPDRGHCLGKHIASQQCSSDETTKLHADAPKGKLQTISGSTTCQTRTPIIKATNEE
jgi:hypothetical protein